jgi:hypothetical protein
VIKQAILAETGATGRAVEFIAVANVIPASTAFYGSIDELKHLNRRSADLVLGAIPKNKIGTMPTDAT